MDKDGVRLSWRKIKYATGCIIVTTFSFTTGTGELCESSSFGLWNFRSCKIENRHRIGVWRAWIIYLLVEGRNARWVASTSFGTRNF